MPSRLDDLARDIEAAEARYHRHVAAMVPRQGQHVGAQEQKANEHIMSGLQASIDLMKAKRRNLLAGVPEDFGIAPPADFEKLVNGKIQRAINAAMEAVGEAIGQMIKDRVKPIEERLKGVEAGGLRYRGTFQRALAAEYRTGDCVTSAGGLWIAVEDAPEGTPGDGPSGWQLCVKGTK